MHCWSGQCREDNHPLPVPNERSGPNVSHHRVERGRGCVEKHPLHHVGSWRPGVAENLVEHILQQYRGRIFFYRLLIRSKDAGEITETCRKLIGLFFLIK